MGHIYSRPRCQFWANRIWSFLWMWSPSDLPKCVPVILNLRMGFLTETLIIVLLLQILFLSPHFGGGRRHKTPLDEQVCTMYLKPWLSQYSSLVLLRLNPVPYSEFSLGPFNFLEHTLAPHLSAQLWDWVVDQYYLSLSPDSWASTYRE